MSHLDDPACENNTYSLTAPSIVSQTGHVSSDKTCNVFSHFHNKGTECTCKSFGKRNMFWLKITAVVKQFDSQLSSFALVIITPCWYCTFIDKCWSHTSSLAWAVLYSCLTDHKKHAILDDSRAL